MESEAITVLMRDLQMQIPNFFGVTCTYASITIRPQMWIMEVNRDDSDSMLTLNIQTNHNLTIKIIQNQSQGFSSELKITSIIFSQRHNNCALHYRSKVWKKFCFFFIVERSLIQYVHQACIYLIE